MTCSQRVVPSQKVLQKQTQPLIATGRLASPTRQGFAMALQNTLRLKEGGLLFAGLPCHSFVFLNLATSQRSSLHPLGNESELYIRLSNSSLRWIMRRSKNDWGNHTWFALLARIIWFLDGSWSSYVGCTAPHSLLQCRGVRGVTLCNGTWNFDIYTCSVFTIPGFLMRILKGYVDIEIQPIVGGSLNSFSQFSFPS